MPGEFCTSGCATNWYERSLELAQGKKHTPEQIVSLLRQIEVAVANGKTTPSASRESGITEQTYYRWRKEYGGLQVDQARRLKELEQENAKLKRLVAELSLDKLVLKDIASGNVWSAPLFASAGSRLHRAVCVNVSVNKGEGVVNGRNILIAA